MKTMNLTNPPEVFKDYLGEVDPEKQVFWVCIGRDLVASEARPKWRRLFYTKEEAEAHACRQSDKWEWDKQPAHKRSLSESLYRARSNGDLGVSITGYNHETGEWVILKEYPADVPLRNLP